MPEAQNTTMALPLSAAGSLPEPSALAKLSIAGSGMRTAPFTVPEAAISPGLRTSTNTTSLLACQSRIWRGLTFSKLAAGRLNRELNTFASPIRRTARARHQGYILDVSILARANMSDGGNPQSQRATCGRPPEPSRDAPQGSLGRQHHDHLAAFRTRRRFDLGSRFHHVADLEQQLHAEFLVRHFTAAEAHRD